jgi:NitT/TauT family transport system ATP-binding protein
MTGLFEITAGFMPLLDSAVLVAAKAKGFDRAEGVDLTLIRETSWANVRDRLAVGHFQVAHVLAPMPIACNLGMTPLMVPMIVPMALSLGGNAVTVSNALWKEMIDCGASPDFDASNAGRALSRIAKSRAQSARPTLRFAVVHPHSGHNYELRYWLAACDIDPTRDVEIVIVPPPLMPDALAKGTIDGFCVGEPWNTAAALQGSGRIATVKSVIWRSSPEKVLGASAEWANSNPDALAALLRALCKSAQWCNEPSKREELARILADDAYVGRPVEWLRPALFGQLRPSTHEVRSIEDFFVPFAKAATFPWKSHALWFYSQMVRWGQIEHTGANAATVRETYRPDLYRVALKPLGVALPVANAKVEGALKSATPVGSAGASLILGPDGFFDGNLFDPDQLDAYIERQRR